MKSFQKTQLAFTEYLRNAAVTAQQIEPKDRHQEIYRDLVYKNINQVISDTFSTTKKMMTESDWILMIRDFIATHRAQTPYFLEICQEFLVYLQQERKPSAQDYPFMRELAHFEWIQLALYIANIDFPERQNQLPSDENSQWEISPIVIGLTYSYPVHLIDADFLPREPDIQPTHLLVYRNRNDDVKILEAESLTLRLVQILQEHGQLNCVEIGKKLSAELADYQEPIALPKLLSILVELADNEIVFFN